MPGPLELTPTAAAWREQGNELYKKGKILEALPLYEKAAAVDDGDFKPLANLCAVQFELGRYEEAIKEGRKALDLMTDVERIGLSGRRLILRTAKSFFLIQEHRAVLEILKDQPEDQEISNLSQSAEHMIDQQASIRRSQESAGRDPRRLLARFKPQLHPHPEFFKVGHDDPINMYRNDINKSSTDEEKISFFLGGIGDARHLYQTLHGVHITESVNSTNRSFHFTVNDIVPEVLARDLVLWLLFDECANAFQKLKDLGPEEKESQEILILREKLVASLFYLFIGHIIPGFVNEMFQSTIKKAISALEETDEILPSWIQLAAKDRKELIPILKFWQSEVFEHCPISQKILTGAPAHQRVRAKDASIARNYGISKPETPMSDDEKDFLETLMLRPPLALSTQVEPELVELFKLPQASKTRTRDLRNYLINNWKTNPTLISPATERISGPEDTSHNPFDFADHVAAVFPPQLLSQFETDTMGSLHDRTCVFFITTTIAIATIRDRLVVEARLGDVTELLDDLRFGSLKDRDTDYPMLYDYIHLSNIPDYTGGNLGTFLLAVPALKLKSTAVVSAVCLRNPPQWDSYEAFNNEYICCPGNSMTEKIFPVHGKPDSACSDDEDRVSRTEYAFLMSEYFHYKPISTDPYPYSSLLTRSELERWVYQLLLKTIIPHPRPMYDFTGIYSPFNASLLFRVLEHLHKVGYPAHWLSSILSDILSDAVSTTSRAPRSNPLKITETKKTQPLRKVSLAPFLAELRVLAAIWSEELPFGFSTATLPTLGSIRLYGMHFEDFDFVGLYTYGRNPVFLLVFWNQSIWGNIPFTSGLRKVLLSDEKGSTEEETIKVRDTGLAIVSCWKWDFDHKLVEFWMDEKVVEAWRNSDSEWRVGIWRDDTYELASNTAEFGGDEGGLLDGPYWIRRKEEAPFEG